VRSPAKIDIITLAIEAHPLHVRRQILDQFHLIGFILSLKQADASSRVISSRVKG